MKIGDIYWLAGILEGEGSFGDFRNSPNDRRGLPIVQLQMTDKDVVEKAAKLMGGHVDGPYSRPGRKDIYKLRIRGNLAIQWMMTLLCLMGSRRFSRIEGIIKRWKVLVKRGRPKCKLG